MTRPHSVSPTHNLGVLFELGGEGQLDAAAGDKVVIFTLAYHYRALAEQVQGLKEAAFAKYLHVRRRLAEKETGPLLAREGE